MNYQNKLQDGRTQCLVCPRQCIMSEGGSGFCNIRQNIDGDIGLISYGYTTGLAVDPIEKKPLYHFLPGSSVLSFGTRGCNMGCLFCQNWTTSKSKEGRAGLYVASPTAIAKLALEHQCQSVAFTYNEPVIFLEYALDTARECRRLGVKTVAVTAGYMNPEPRKEFYREIDAVNVDLKAFTDDFYRRNCQAELSVVLETIEYIKKETETWLELTTLLIEGENDSEEELRAECRWITEHLGTETPLHFSAFHPAWKFQDRKTTSPETLFKAHRIAKEAGIRYVYTGNILHAETSATYCPNCGKAVITRNRFQADAGQLHNGHCAFCHTALAGTFE